MEALVEPGNGYIFHVIDHETAVGIVDRGSHQVVGCAGQKPEIIQWFVLVIFKLLRIIKGKDTGIDFRKDLLLISDHHFVNQQVDPDGDVLQGCFILRVPFHRVAFHACQEKQQSAFYVVSWRRFPVKRLAGITGIHIKFKVNVFKHPEFFKGRSCDPYPAHDCP